MAGYCKSCFRDLPSEDEDCRRCARSTASRSSPLIGVLLFALVLAGMLTFDARLTTIAAAMAVILIAVYVARPIRGEG